MKNLLLTTLLASAAITSTTEKPTKQEMLANLQNIKIELQNELTETIAESKRDPNKTYLANLDILWNEILALKAIAPYSFEIDYFMNILENQKIETLEQLCNSGFNYPDYNGNECPQDKLLRSVFLKLYNDEQTAELVMNDFQNKECWDMAIVFNNLLQRIDAKIKELEAQV